MYVTCTVSHSHRYWAHSVSWMRTVLGSLLGTAGYRESAQGPGSNVCLRTLHGDSSSSIAADEFLLLYIICFSCCRWSCFYFDTSLTPDSFVCMAAGLSHLLRVIIMLSPRPFYVMLLSQRLFYDNLSLIGGVGHFLLSSTFCLDCCQAISDFLFYSPLYSATGAWSLPLVAFESPCIYVHR